MMTGNEPLRYRSVCSVYATANLPPARRCRRGSQLTPIISQRWRRHK